MPTKIHQNQQMKITLKLKFIIVLIVLVFNACHFIKSPFHKQMAYTTIDSASMKQILEAIRTGNNKNNNSADEEDRIYRAAAAKSWDLVNTDLEVAFDYSKAQLKGIATLTLMPHAYNQDSLLLDAKGMDILAILDADTQTRFSLPFHYDGKKLAIRFPKAISVGVAKKVRIEYVAKPNDIIVQGSDAITSDKGLYFINNDGKEVGKPRQIWTQGETESNSCWFPTLDKPNQKMTQCMRITVQDSNDITLSNGKFVSRTKNQDGTFTDYWVQSLPAAPYLTMMVVGRFYVEHDTWNGLDVNYYVEPEFKPYAKLIFGKTPAMISFFSSQLGIDFPWEKYSQIVVRDYVSGSMENASATLHGEFLQYDSRDYIDDTKEDYICHELFHQWFGDLVTCESWSNLPLNESFATYGEYLWIEHERGAMEAGMHLEDDKRKYFKEAAFKQESLIRFRYEDKEELFDRHSYQKGACILHMLRYELGDAVFFKGLRSYLNKNKFKSVEVHDLRLAMEEASGLDLNWFFNQWFFRSGHAKAIVNRAFNEETKTQHVAINFSKEEDKASKKYQLSVKVDFYFKDSVHHEKLILDKWSNEFDFSFAEKPLFVIIDANRALLWELSDNKSKEELMFQLVRAPLYQDKKEAVDLLLEKDEMTLEEKKPLIEYCLAHEFYGVKAFGLEFMEFIREKDLEIFYPQLSTLLMVEKNSSLRVSLLRIINKMGKTHDILPLLRSCTNDSSYWVMSTAIDLLSVKDLGTALKICQANEHIQNAKVMNSINTIYSQDTTANHANYFINSVSKCKGFDRNVRLREIDFYLRRTNIDFACQTIKGIASLKPLVLNGYNGSFFSDMAGFFQYKKLILEDEMMRAKYSEEGYNLAKHRLETYTTILNLLK